MSRTIVVGSSLAALHHAHNIKATFILNQRAFPDKFTPVYVKNAWGLLYTKLSLNGYMVGGDSVDKIQIKEDTINVVCENRIVNSLLYDELHIFSDYNVIDLPDATRTVDEYEIIDILSPVSLTTTPQQKKITTGDNLVAELFILKENDVSSIEIFSVSHLNKKQLTNFDYSDTMVKFKSEELLTSHGFVGTSRGPNASRLAISLDVVKRLVRKKMDFYEDTNKIKFFYGN